MTRMEFWETMNEICKAFDGSITSGRRTKKRNRQVGGAPNSRHLTGTAADIVLDDWSKKETVMTLLREKGITVIDETRSRAHLHCHIDEPKEPQKGTV